jgi:futalosine hydrolase
MKSIAEICTMRILLTAATKQEVEPYTIKNKTIDLLITGVGVPSTLFQLQKAIFSLQPDIIIQAGVAGSFSNSLSLGQVVLVKQDAFGDIGMEENKEFTPIFKSNFADANEFPFSDGWLINPSKLFSVSKLKNVKAITVNKVSDSEVQKNQSIIHFSPEIETMEGAAFHFIGLHQKIPFIQLRSISNTVGERDKSKWELKESIGNLNKELEILVELIKNKNPFLTN